MTFPVVSSWCSKHNIMIVFGEGGSQTLLARSKHLMASGSALTEVPVTSVLIGGRVNGQVLTQDVTAPCDVTGLLRRFHKQAPLIAMSTSLKLQNICFSSYCDNGRQHQGKSVTRNDGHGIQFDLPQSFPQGPGSEQSPPSTGSPCSLYVCPLSKCNNTIK